MKNIICGDVKDRVRQSNYLWMIIFLIFAVCLVDLPNANYYALLVSPNYFAQMNNVTWIMMSVMMVFGFLMPPIEWVFIKNAEEIDRSNRIYNWMFSTSLNKLNYVFGKFISNVILLLSLWVTIILVTIIIGIIKFPNEVSLLISRLPNFLIFLPGILSIAACALLFENFKILRGAFGTILGVGGYFIIYAATTFKTSFWSLLNFSNSQMIIDLIRVDGKSNGISNPSISVLGTKAYTNFEKHNLVFSLIKLTPQDIIIFICQLFLTLILLGIVYYTLKDFVINSSNSMIENNNFTHNLSYEEKKLSNYKKRPKLSFIIYDELKRMWYETSRIRKLFLVIIWIVAWCVPLHMTMEILAFVFLLALKYYDHLGVTIVNTGIFSYIGSIKKARNNQFLAEIIAGFFTTIVILIPVIIKSQSFWLYFWFAIATVLLCEAFGRITRSIRPIQFISVCYWFIYLNGGNLLSNQWYYTGVTVICIVILSFKQILTNRVNNIE